MGLAGILLDPCRRSRDRGGRRALLGAGVLLLVLAAGLSSAAETPDVRRPRKLIETGWDQPSDMAWLREHVEEMERRPFDGVVIHLEGKRDDGSKVSLLETFGDKAWKREWFQGSLADLKATRFKRFTDNFIVVWANPGGVDWFDDTGWRTIAAHCRIAAWLARESGVRGLLFDPEPYTPPHAQFSYAAQPGRDKHTFDEYGAKARERGREVMQAIVAEHPTLALFSYFMDSVNPGATGHADPRPVLAKEGYGLLPAFIDGWLDAAPPTVTFVDGCESAYRYNSDLEYLAAGNLIRNACQDLVSAANRAKYRAQFQVSFGIYLDAYVNPPTSPWYIDGKGGPRVDRLRANVRTALRVADEYVWVYGEKCRWWPTPNKSVTAQSWPEALPGCEEALRYARDPDAYGRWKMAELGKAGKLLNLARNGDFGAAKAVTEKGDPVEWKAGAPPAGWFTWQREKSAGTLAWDRDVGAAGKGSARAARVADGCFLQGYKVRPGERYAVQAARRLQGQGDAGLMIRWQTPEGKWLEIGRDVEVPCPGPRGEWREMLGVAEVPEGAGLLLLLLVVRGQSSAEDVAWFDDVGVCRLE